MSNARNDASGNGETVARCGHMAVQSNGSRCPRSSARTLPAFDPLALGEPIGAVHRSRSRLSAWGDEQRDRTSKFPKPHFG